MDLAFSNFERMLFSPLAEVPDFAVLIAGLSARQSTSVTAQRQTRLAMGDIVRRQGMDARVSLFAEGRVPDYARSPGSFSPAAAEMLAPQSPNMTGKFTVQV